jgi:stage V sporulation protein AB
MIAGLAAVLIMLLGLSGGIAVGTALVALLVVLDLIPRLAQLAGSYRLSRVFESAIVSGAVFWTAADFFHWQARFPEPTHLFIGLFCGIFVGMLAAALTEVLNMLPILARRLGVAQYIAALLMAMVLGKVTGSLFDWIVFQR